VLGVFGVVVVPARITTGSRYGSRSEMELMPQSTMVV